MATHEQFPAQQLVQPRPDVSPTAQTDLQNTPSDLNTGETSTATHNLTPVSPESVSSTSRPCHWTPDATLEQVIYGAASDLATLVSLLAARTKVATGFQSDAESIQRTIELSARLRNIVSIFRELRKHEAAQCNPEPVLAPYKIQTNIAKRRRKLKRVDDCEP